MVVDKSCINNRIWIYKHTYTVWRSVKSFMHVCRFNYDNVSRILCPAQDSNDVIVDVSTMSLVNQTFSIRADLVPILFE